MRIARDGTVSHRVEIRLKVHPAERATFKRLTDPKKWAQATESAIREGRYFRIAEARKHTLGDAIGVVDDNSSSLDEKKRLTQRQEIISVSSQVHQL
jgi:hypothetical protein